MSTTTIQQDKLYAMDEVKTFIRAHSLPGFQVGNWVWVSFTSKPTRDVRERLVKAGFRWISQRGRWAHSCGNPSRPNRRIKPWQKYGAVDILADSEAAA